MKKDEKSIIYHIDVNSAFLSWEAAYRIGQGETLDLRKIPSVVGGDPKTRHGIVLAKSIPAKEYKIKTGETLYSALQKCPNLKIVSPSYELYIKCSKAMMEILKEYSPFVEKYSIDECFIEYTPMKDSFRDPMAAAYHIRDRIYEELGFTVNIGVSNNKLLAKMASDFTKPNKVHTLFPEEVQKKMWPLPIDDLFMVGRATVPKLKKIGIFTIGDLANYNGDHIKYLLKSHGFLIWQYANGIDHSKLTENKYIERKGIGNSRTIPFDVTDKITAHGILLSLTERVAMRLRNANFLSKVICISIKNSQFKSYSHQRKLFSPTDSTNEIYRVGKELFDEVWKGEPIRHLGIRISDLSSHDFVQSSLFDDSHMERDKALDEAIDHIRLKYGSKSLVRATALHSGIKPLSGGVEAHYEPMVSSTL